MKTERLLPLFLLLALISLPLLAATSNELINQGNDNWRAKKLDEAEASYRQAIEVDPDNARAYSNLGALLLSQNRDKEAVSTYQNAIIHDPENPRLFAALSIAYLHMGYHQMAQAMAARALEIDPEMKGVKKLAAYIDAKLAQQSPAKPPQDATHQGMGGGDPHANIDSKP